MRTNIVIDDRLMERALEVSDAQSKRAVVEEALKLLIQVKGAKSLLDLEGEVKFAKGYDYKALRVR